MNKRKAFVYGLLVIVAGVTIWFYLRKPSGQPTVRPASAETNQAAVAPNSVQNGQPVAVPPPTSNPTPENNPAAWIEQRRKQMDVDRQEGLNQWRTPIEFYGEVVDEKDLAVAGASIHFIWTDLSQTGNSERTATSNSNGLFSLRDATGKNLIVEVSKPGYYEYRSARMAFNYAGENQNFVPNAASPVIFRLKKKEAAEPLVHIQAPMGGAKGFRLARDGTALEISLVTGKAVALGQGDLRVECKTDDQGRQSGQKYDWKCQISVPGGGLVLSTQDLDFQAPMGGYEQSDVINMPASLGKDWGSQASRTYFLKLANGNYARMSFEMVAGGDHFFRVESFLNPSGSRNLEFDPAKQIPVKP